jgi:hypothetical protein
MPKKTKSSNILDRAAGRFNSLANARANVSLTIIIVLFISAFLFVLFAFSNANYNSADASIIPWWLKGAAQQQAAQTTTTQTQQTATTQTSTDPGDTAFLAAHPNAPTIVLDQNEEPEVGRPAKFKITETECSINRGKSVGWQVWGTAYVQWGEDNSDPEPAAFVCNDAGVAGNIANQKARVFHTFKTGGTHRIRVWASEPSGFVGSIPEGHLDQHVKGSPVSPVVCNDQAGLTAVIAADSPAAGTVHSYDQDVVFTKVTITAAKDTWVTEALVFTNTQSNIYFWRQDLRRITVVSPTGQEIGHLSLFADPADINAQPNAFDTNSAVGSTGGSSPIIQQGMKIPLTPFRMTAGQSVTLSLLGTPSAQAENNNMWRFGLAGLRCYGSMNYFKNSPPYLYLDDPRYFNQTSPNLKFGSIQTIASAHSSGSGGYNKKPCAWGVMCADMYPRNRGINYYPNGLGGGQGSGTTQSRTTTGGN